MITNAFKEMHVCLYKHRQTSAEDLMSTACVLKYAIFSQQEREKNACALFSIKVLSASPVVITVK